MTSVEAEAVIVPVEQEIRRRLRAARVRRRQRNTIERIILPLMLDLAGQIYTAESVTGGLISRRR